MIFIRKFVGSFGVALCAAPMLLLLVPNIWAQQGNNQSQMLFEMQAMRQEIAELRDMVERQAYQIRQLQKPSAQNGNRAPTAGSSASPYSVNQQQAPAVNQQPTDLQQYQTTATEVPTAGGVPTANGVPTADSMPSVYSDTAENSNYPSALPNQGTSDQVQNNYPPVEERTITGDGQQVPAYDPETYNRQQAPAVNRQQAPAVNQQQAAVINPGDVTANDPNFPQPYQRDVPARLPIPNNIPNADPSGGVVAIPQEKTTQPLVTETNTAAPATNTTGLGEQTYYQQGFELLKESKHDEAVTTFKKQIGDYPNGDYADDAHYWIAESLYVNRDLDQSKLYFKAIINNFAQSPRLPDAMLKTAYIEQEQGNVIEARILLQEIIQFHPRSNAAISAKNRLADLD